MKHTLKHRGLLKLILERMVKRKFIEEVYNYNLLNRNV